MNINTKIIKCEKLKFIEKKLANVFIVVYNDDNVGQLEKVMF